VLVGFDWHLEDVAEMTVRLTHPSDLTKQSVASLNSQRQPGEKAKLKGLAEEAAMRVQHSYDTILPRVDTGIKRRITLWEYSLRNSV
jgi:hypothetical protein